MSQFNDSSENNLLYLAASLFSKAELEFNISLRKMLKPYFNMYLPQEDGGLLKDMVSAGAAFDVASRKVFNSDIIALNKCDILLIVLDGRFIDEGAAFELGYAYALGKNCYGLQTDNRRIVFNNPMINSSLKKIFNDVNSLIKWARYYKLNDTNILHVNRTLIKAV